jgi:hypothetical protein
MPHSTLQRRLMNISSKQEFELFSAKYGVTISSIRAENGVYATKCFRESCMKKQQDLTFCAVGAHRQNGIVERSIRTITEKARTILLMPCTDGRTRYMKAISFHNNSIHKDNKSTPHELFTGESSKMSLMDFRIFGSPAYVLDKALQDGKQLNKWQARSWQGIYIGVSTCHSGHVP